MRLPAIVLGVVVAAGAPLSAQAGYPTFVGTRPLGMGGALRGAATGDAAPMLNPSGISLLRAYNLEGAYLWNSGDKSHIAHVSAVDSTSGFGLGGALYYTYRNSSPDPADKEIGHEVGGSISLPLGDRVFLGTTLKWIYQRNERGKVTNSRSGLTLDVGATLRPVSVLAIGVVGYNLIERSDPHAPRSFGGGLALTPLPDLVLAFDSVLDFTTYDPDRGNVVSLMGGAEYVFVKKFGVRGGWNHDGLTDNMGLSAGLSVLSEIGAIDFGFRDDISGAHKALFVGVSLRIFVPSPGE